VSSSSAIVVITLERARRYILGIESSCDETAAAVVRSGEELISNVVYSQIATHQPFGGVVPELASREHLRAIVPVVRKALEDAGKTYDSIDAIAVTQGPGLAGALLVGLSYAKTLAFAADKHSSPSTTWKGTFTPCCSKSGRTATTTQFPVLALVVSGAHAPLQPERLTPAGPIATSAIPRRRRRPGLRQSRQAARTGYPGGPVIDSLPTRNPRRKVPFAQIKHRDRNPQTVMPPKAPHRFSYSGIKTAGYATSKSTTWREHSTPLRR
jgi:N6-L-threonylcarbamoyladenine synthase